MPPAPPEIGPLPKALVQAHDQWYPWEKGPQGTPAKPLVELAMVHLSSVLRSKPSWWTKFRDPDILAKWRAEALEQTELLKGSHIDYVLKELDGYANLRDEETGAEVACYDLIWKSDRLISPQLKDNLISGVSELENVPESEKDWHPDSNGTVLDLVHPSLYPIVYGRTLAYPSEQVTREADNLETMSPPEYHIPESRSRGQRTSNYHLSKKFQWLPTDFIVSEDSKSVKSVSYINNLHPDEHSNLHSTIERIIGAFIPLFERVLTDSVPKNKAVPTRTNNSYQYDVTDYAPNPDYSEHGDMEEYERLYQEWEDGRPIQLPDVSPEGYVLGSLESRDTWYSLAGRTIQVIVKLANIHLSPEKPEYTGGSWHIEGMGNEAIAASGIYYYDEDNITESQLAFRTAAAIPYTYEQWDERGCVLTCQDRAICFPNIYQHKVSPFELKDKTKPGHRKILALFLVDPAIHIPSTTTVPPQQHDWRTKTISADPKLKAIFEKLSPEIISHIDALAGGTMTREEAEAYRLGLMEERKVYVAKNDKKFFRVKFDMCEH
ncbi:hypothetical protein RhiJN_20117 [Ceratobasidium sp. AG-Ba]|nr:hypothetical protein RhiJN_20117 [Ceratobasidium sp. AG-Ba]